MAIGQYNTITLLHIKLQQTRKTLTNKRKTNNQIPFSSQYCLF